MAGWLASSHLAKFQGCVGPGGSKANFVAADVLLSLVSSELYNRYLRAGKDAVEDTQIGCWVDVTTFMKEYVLTSNYE